MEGTGQGNPQAVNQPSGSLGTKHEEEPGLG